MCIKKDRLVILVEEKEGEDWGGWSTNLTYKESGPPRQAADEKKLFISGFIESMWFQNLLCGGKLLENRCLLSEVSCSADSWKFEREAGI